MDQTETIIVIVIITLSLVAIVLLVCYWALHLRKNRMRPKVRNLTKEQLESKRKEFKAQLHEQGLEDLERAVIDNTDYIRRDVRKTAANLNELMQTEIKQALDDEFNEYHNAVGKINQMVSQAITRTQESLEQQRQDLDQQMQREVALEKDQLIAIFENNMSEVVSYYVAEALGDKLTIDDQMDYILAQLQDNKQAIIEDLKSGR